MEGIVAQRRLISDASRSDFVSKIKYKSQWFGETVLEVGRLEPSSKICNSRYFHKNDLTLETRNWSCSVCETIHDRDVKAAIDIK